jgi:hypothetical protein
MKAIVRFTSAACIMFVVTASSSAQTIRPTEWSHGTTLSGFAGVPVQSEDSGVALGGAVGWEVTARFAIEGSGSWLDFGDGADGFAGTMMLRTRLFGRRTVDPFVQGGVGMYIASFDAGATLPPFYERRTDVPRLADAVTFTDPTLVAGGGANIYLSRHLAIRPDITATFVLRDGEHHFVPTFGLHVVYHFEDHPVTPGLRPSRWR